MIPCSLHGVERHRHGPDQNICDGERSDEEVGRLSDLPVHNEGDENQEVAEGRDHDADGQADRDEDGHEGAKGGGPALRAAGCGISTYNSGDGETGMNTLSGTT